MRVTHQALFLRITEDVQQAYQRLVDTSRQASSGKRINAFRDDPLGVARVFDLRSIVTSLQQYSRNITTSQPFLEQTDTALGQVSDTLLRAKELALIMTNDTHTAQDRQSAAVEVNQLFEQVLLVANTEVAGRFLFGGFQNDAAPFDSTGAYLGDNGDMAIQTGSTSTLSLNVTGSRVFQGVGGSAGVGVFDTLRDLATVLNADGNGDVYSLNLALSLDSSATTPGSAFPTDGGAKDKNPTVGVIDADLSDFLAASNFSTKVPVFDSLGGSHTLTFFFRNAGGNNWDYRVAANAEDLGGTSPDLRQVGDGTLAFDGAGALDVPSSMINPIGLTGLVNGADDITIPSGSGGSLTFTGSTQLATPSEVLTLSRTNTDGFAPQIARLDAALDQIISVRVEVGARLNTAEAAQQRLDSLAIQTTSHRAEIEEVDVFEIFLELSRLEQTFTAALQVSARLTQLSLLDFLQ